MDQNHLISLLVGVGMCPCGHCGVGFVAVWCTGATAEGNGETLDDIFCLFQGYIENVALRKQQYGLNKTANEVIIVIEAYRTQRDRGPYPADQVVRDLSGKFAFILYDSTAKTTFLAFVGDGSVPFYWGNDSEGNLVLSDDTKF